MKRCVLYMRVSTVDQHPESQLHDLRLMAQQRGYDLVGEYTDRITGTKAKRPGLDDLLRDARRGCFDVVLVWASDRLARSVRHFLEVLDELSHLGIEYVSSGRTSTPAARWGGPWSSSSAPSPNWNATSLWKGSGQGCAGQNWKAGKSAVNRWTSIAMPCCATAPAAKASPRSPRASGSRAPASAAW